ncbi:hypothetical protein [Cognatiyoonia sp.]
MAIGGDWPSDGVKALPDLETFLAAVGQAASPQVMEELIIISDAGRQP